MRNDYLDMGYWEHLARKRHIRLPRHASPLKRGLMERYLALCGVTISAYRAWSGFRTLKQFIEANPEWSARAFVGLLLELSEEQADASEPQTHQ